MSPSCMAATSAERRPKRAKKMRTARSRRPLVVEPSQLSNKEPTSAWLMAEGKLVPRQAATGGMALPRSLAISPRKYKKRNSARRSAASRLADSTTRRNPASSM